MPACIVCKTRNVQFVIPTNKDPWNISLGLHFVLDRFKKGWELDIVLKILREAYSGFFPGRAYISFSF